MSSWKSDKLIYRTPTGKVRTWRVETTDSGYRTYTGDVDGSEAESAITWCHAKGKGAAYRDAFQVAIDTAASKVQSKMDEGYCRNTAELMIQDTVPRAMLAQSRQKGDRVTKAISVGKAFLQPKLDGYRALVMAGGIWSRDLRSIETMGHIRKAIEPLFVEHPDLVIDGELYSHEHKGNFAKIQSLITKRDRDLFEELEAEKIKLHVYDMVSDMPFRDRFIKARNLLQNIPHVELVTTIRINNETHLAELHARFTGEGYEGSMIRTSYEGYEPKKRAKQLVKLKDFDDSEFTIVSVNEGRGQWTGYAKTIECTDGTINFDAGCAGTQEFLQSVLQSSDYYVGRKVTVKYFGKFASGKPRFPIAIKFH